jgi:hypothetical protein
MGAEEGQTDDGNVKNGFSRDPAKLGKIMDLLLDIIIDVGLEDRVI